jgi:homoserine dehydrogenase
MKTSLAANEIYRIDGILNGTTNYILTHMRDDGTSFAEALAQAQQKGYAEANPKADVDGDDACRKICILAALAFGAMIPQSLVNCEGISNVTLDTIEKAKKFGGDIKLIASARRMTGEKIDISVSPCVVSSENPLSGVSDVFNAIMIHAQHLGDVMMYGKGAGKLPTASAVLSDIIEIAKSGKNTVQETWNIGDPSMLSDNDTVSDNFCVYVTHSFGASSAKVLTLFGKAQEVFSDSEGFGVIIENVSRNKIRKTLHTAGIKEYSVFRYIK